jgi:prophage regulatory protein
MPSSLTTGLEGLNMQLPFSEMPDEAILRLPQVKALVGLSRSTIYDNVAAGCFPKQIKLTSHAAGWRVRDIRKYLANPTGWKPAADHSDSQAA